MNKKDTINKLKEVGQITKTQAEAILDTFIADIRNELAKTGKSEVCGLGTFKTVDTQARQGRNPKTGEAIEIPAGKRIKFSACKALKGAV
jgi:nucleoid DNA-binding protein